MKIVGVAVALVAAVSASSAEARDIVADAADAIAAQDADTLENMRFDAYDLDNTPLSVDNLLDRVSQCKFLDQMDPDLQPYPREIHFACEQSQDDQGPCESNILIVALDRATSPHVFAQLRFKRLETSACALPQAPVSKNPNNGL
ncbi:MAG: hypothetical protein ABJF89_07150 [Parasphingorhabdus sp.]|uniref:hypothetical protein n=1 Tax=Parasphingorhabdus sp. TaxID=2709688 RepID=UPI003264CC01